MTDSQSQVRRVLVVGAGITGLAAACRLLDDADEKQEAIDVTLLEAGSTTGGVIRTLRRDGYLIEAGPDNFITTKPWALKLAQELGIHDQLIETNRDHRRALVVHRGQLLPVPDGFQMMAPTRSWPVMASRLLSPTAKLRLAIEPFIPPRRSDDDESLASFVTRRFGRQLLDRLVQPLVGGIYTADADQLSVRATIPEFLDMEARYGSVWRGMRARAKDLSNDAGARYSRFVTFRDGMQTLCGALVDRIGLQRLRLNQTVTSIRPSTTARSRWTVSRNNAADLDADGVILALPAHHGAPILSAVDPTLARLLAGIRYASSAVVNLGYRRQDITHSMNAFGFVVPAIEKRRILAASFSSIKYPHRAPDGCVLLRLFVGGATQPQLLELDDRSLVRLAQEELADLLGVHNEPHLVTVDRWPRCMPQYAVGHLDRVRAIRKRTERLDGLELAGNACDGVGIPDCVDSAQQAVQRLFTDLRDNTP